MGASEGWRTFGAGPILATAEPDPYVERHAQAEVHLAERLYHELARLLRKERGHDSSRVVLYLVAGRYDRPPPMPGALVRTLHPDSVAEPLAMPLARLLVERWFGSGALEAGFFLDGIAGLALARSGLGATVTEADAWVQAEMAAGRPVSIFSSSSPALTSFAAFLQGRFGTEPMQRFLASYDPIRRDEAALAAYERTLGALEESWLFALRRRSGKTAAYRAFLRHMLPLLRPYRYRQLEYLAYTLLAVVASLALPLAARYLVDVVVPSRSGRLLAEFVLVVLAVYAVNAVVNVRRSYVNNWINQHMLNSLSETMFARLQRLGHDFYGRAKVGDLTARLSGDVSVVILAMYQVTGIGLDAALKALAAAIALLLLSPLLGVPVLAVLPLLLITSLALRSRQEKESLALQQLVGEKANLVQENLTGHALVKAFGLESRAGAAYRAMVDAILRAALRLSVLTAMTDTTSALALILAELVVLGFGGWLVIQGQLTIGTLLAFIGLLGALYQPVQLLVGLGQTVQRATSSMDRMAEILDEPLTLDQDPGAVALPRLAGSVSLEQVSFGYGTGRAIVRDLDLEIKSGSGVAIVGPSGAGKSTVTSLLLRFWDPDQGRVLFDGVDIRRATLQSLRDQIGIVFQDTFILDTTLRENIRVGRLGASDEEIAAAAHGAQLDSFVESLPQGFDTVLGERGTRMSGGQRQRIAIARVILRDPALLILDEATSALDPHTEKEILETLHQVSRGRTTISITHRLAIAAAASLIYVMDHGTVVEKGSHAELMALGGLYRRLYLEQSGGERTLDGDTARLARVGLFRGLDPAVIESVAQRLHLHRFGADETVVRQGETGDRMYLVMSGRLEVAVEDPLGPRRVAVLAEGDHFGEMALLSGEPRTATVRTIEGCELLALSIRDFNDLSSREPALKAAVDDLARQRRAALDSITAGAPSS